MRKFGAGRQRWTLGILAVGLTAGQAVQATELSATPLLRYTADYASNRRMAFDTSNPPPNGTQGNLFTLGVDLAGQNERTKISMQPRFDLLRILGSGTNENLDTENVFLNLDASHFLAERFAVTLAGKYAYDSLLTTEAGGNETGGGLVDATQSRRIERLINPGLRFLLTERDSVDLGVGYNDVSYDQSTTNTYRDYRLRSANARWTHQLSDSDRAFVNFFASQFRVPAVPTFPTFRFPVGGNDTDNYGLNFGYSGKFWEYWSASIGAGIQYTQSKFPQTVAQIGLPGPQDQARSFCLQTGSQFVPVVAGNRAGPQVAGICSLVLDQEDDDFGALFDFELVRTFERGRASVAYNRTIGPTGFGSQQTVDVIELHGERSLTDRLRAYLDFAYSMSDYSGQTTGGFANRTYYSAGGHLDYKLFQYVTVMGSYYYRSQDYGQSTDTLDDRIADTHVVMLSIAYNGEKFTFFR